MQKYCIFVHVLRRTQSTGSGRPPLLPLHPPLRTRSAVDRTTKSSTEQKIPRQGRLSFCIVCGSLETGFVDWNHHELFTASRCRLQCGALA